MKSFRIFLTLTLVGSNAYAKNSKLLNLERELRNKENFIQKISAEITDIENNVGSVNLEYLDKVKIIENLENKINTIEYELDLNAKNISKEYRLSKRALNNYLIERVDNSYENEEIREKIFLSLLQKKLKKLNEIQEQNSNLLSSLNKIEEKLSDAKQEEVKIYDEIVELENTKKEKGQKYISLLEEKNKLADEVEKLILSTKTIKKQKKTANIISKNKFILPLSDYLNIKKDKKGLSFSYKDVVPLHSPANGIVVYAGELSNYGKIIMINHGEDIISVLLGDFSLKLKKGVKVNQGQIVGYTVPSSVDNKTVYFEIRKENKVQNATAWYSNLNFQKKITKI